jgi:hypothetical protein
VSNSKSVKSYSVTLVLVLLLPVSLLSGCKGTETNSGQVQSPTADSKLSESQSTAPSFSADNLFDGVARLDSEFEERFGFEPMGVPQRATPGFLSADSVAPERCSDFASVLASYGQPDSNEAGFMQASWIGHSTASNWGYINGFRTTAEYRENLARSLTACSEFSSQWEADTIFNGQPSFETSEYRITEIVSAQPDHIVVSLEAVLRRQLIADRSKLDCLDIFGPSCIATLNVAYRLHIVSSGEYSLSFMIETWRDESESSSLGVAVSDMNAIDEIAYSFLSEIS